MPLLRQPLVRTLLFLLCLNGGVVAAELPEQPHIVVEGVGAIEQVPDVVNVTAEIAVTAADFATAKQQVDHVVGRIILAGRDFNVLVDDINASKINAVPQYEWQKQERIYKGEQVTRTVEIRLRESEHYNDLVDALLKAGITRLQNIQLEFSKRSQLEAEAMELALDDAEAQAKAIAKHLRTKLLKPWQVAPVSRGPVLRTLEMAAMASDSAAKAESAPLKLAKQKIEQRVRVIYLLND